MDGLVKAVLRRAGGGGANSPQWIHLHDLFREEVELLKADGLVPLDLPIVLNFQASRDLLYGVHTDFAEVISQLLQHALNGAPHRVTIRSWGGQRHFRLEVVDDGTPIDARLLGRAFEPFSELQPPNPVPGRQPGQGLPACAQLMNAYGGTLQIQHVEVGSLVRISLPMD
jgi:signal transduction histidine kinase